MHFEILIEDMSGKTLMDILVPKIIAPPHTFKIYPYKGIGKLPKDLHKYPDPKVKMLLNKLPYLLQGYGKSLNPNDNAVIVVVDCDKRDCKTFKNELIRILEQCNPKPTVVFSIAIEEIEAWLLGDEQAVGKAYPKMDKKQYSGYKHDSIIGTWEKLAEITLPPSTVMYLKKNTYPEIGQQKNEWAQKIGVYMDINNNKSTSFNYFKRKLEELTNCPKTSNTSRNSEGNNA